MTFRIMCLASLVALSGCQSLRVQGVKVAESDSFWPVIIAVAGGVAVAALIQEDDEDQPEKCSQFVSVPTGKGDFICAEGN